MQQMEQFERELQLLLDLLPEDLLKYLPSDEMPDLIEIVLDLGRIPQARYSNHFRFLGEQTVTPEVLAKIVSHLGPFGDDNRTGIERTLHRISAIRNRVGDIIGLTLRVGRALYGTIEPLRDVVAQNRSILLLGKPGVGKTTMLREMARVLADEMEKRVVIVDTSNEIGGDGDIPHPGIGHARRMQVPKVNMQHAVMIEAVENHMPEVVVIDEIGTAEEAAAARTIAERGVMLIATAHGITLQNLIQNPTLSDLVGGIQSVTLSDEEARRRGTQKSVLERKETPTFDVLIEIFSRETLYVHQDVAATVDLILRGLPATPEIRAKDEKGQWNIQQESQITEQREDLEIFDHGTNLDKTSRFVSVITLYPYAVNRNLIEKAIKNHKLPIQISREVSGSDVFITLKSQLRRIPDKLKEAHQYGVPILTVRANTSIQIENALKDLVRRRPEGKNQKSRDSQWIDPLEEAELAVEQIMETHKSVELQPQDSYTRRLQHELAEQYRLRSRSIGDEPYRRVVIFP